MRQKAERKRMTAESVWNKHTEWYAWATGRILRTTTNRYRKKKGDGLPGVWGACDNQLCIALSTLEKKKKTSQKTHTVSGMSVKTVWIVLSKKCQLCTHRSYWIICALMRCRNSGKRRKFVSLRCGKKKKSGMKQEVLSVTTWPSNTVDKKGKKDKAFSLESLLVLILPPPHVSFKGIKL